jgi:hypothetical protein
LENLTFTAAQVGDPMTAALGIEVDLLEVRPQQLEGEPIPLAEIPTQPDT